MHNFYTALQKQSAGELETSLGTVPAQNSKLWRMDSNAYFDRPKLIKL